MTDLIFNRSREEEAEKMIFNLFGKNRKKGIEDNLVRELKGKEEKPRIKTTRIGELGEYKINIQLEQLPGNCKHLSDLFLPNSKSVTGYSQIDHVILSPFAVFVIETKNYTGTIYGDSKRKKWSVNGKFQMANPFHQNFGHIQSIRPFLTPIEGSDFISIVSFTKRCTFKINPELRKIQSNDLIVYDTELTDFVLRKLNVLKLQKKKAVFSESRIRSMYDQLQNGNILDAEHRKKHTEVLRDKSNHGETRNTYSAKSATCKVCGKHVSQKVESFCMANKERFKGEIYCFEHQSMIDK